MRAKKERHVWVRNWCFAFVAGLAISVGPATAWAEVPWRSGPAEIVRMDGSQVAERAASAAAEDPQTYWLNAFRSVRAETERRAALLSAEDQVVQSMPETSPTKWHRAHVSWFFEQFLLAPHAGDYRPFDQRFAYLYNSYYVSAGP